MTTSVVAVANPTSLNAKQETTFWSHVSEAFKLDQS
jgi:hypothetical protein